jgi:biopolymer transport protein ExbD
MANQRKADEPLDIDINRVITPMLDVAFQVFAFFIATFHPAQLEGVMQLSLPEAAQAQAPTPQDAKPDMSSAGELELPSEVTVILKTQQSGTRDGGISQISVQERAGTKEVPSQQALRRYLEQIRDGLSNQSDIKLEADSELKYAFVIEIMDVCHRAGFKNVGFAPPPDWGGVKP